MALTYDQARLEDIKAKLGDVYEYMRGLKDKKIELLTIGDDEVGGSIQIRLSDLRNHWQINPWLVRSVEKVKKISWVHIEITGHDVDGDYRSKKFEFKDLLGKQFLDVCWNAPMNETPLHHLLTIEYLKQ